MSKYACFKSLFYCCLTLTMPLFLSVKYDLLFISAHEILNAEKCRFFYVLKLSDNVLILLINVNIVGILTFMSRINIMLFISSPEPKAQVRYCDWSVVRLTVNS